MKQIKNIVIDPHTGTVEVLMREAGNLQAIYDALSNDKHKVTHFDAVRLDAKNYLYCDDEGMMVAGNPTFCFNSNPHTPFAGRCIITGTDGEGDDADTTLPVEIIRAAITFLDLVSTGDFGPTTSGDREDGMFVIVGGRPILRDKDEL